MTDNQWLLFFGCWFSAYFVVVIVVTVIFIMVLEND